MTTLSSKIRLCKNINLDRDYKNVLNYTESQMLSLCESQSHLVASANDYSFIRNRGTISTNFSYDDCLQSNYIAFQNKDYSNKWFFAFIDDVSYIGENNTEIKYTIDSWSTWFDYWTAKPCFVLREHVNDDTIGLNTELENLDVGEVFAESITKDLSLTSVSGFFVAVSTNYLPNDNTTGLEALSTDRGTKYSGISVYNRNIFGTRIILFYVTTSTTFANITKFIKRVNADGEVASIENLFILPYLSVPLQSITSHTAYFQVQDSEHQFEFYTIPFTLEPKTWYQEITKITSYTGLTIKNNKCFCYPYNYLLVTNGSGSNNIYKYENFYSNTCKFLNTFSISIGGSGRLAPLRYKENYSENTSDFDSANYDETLPFAKFPTCSWSSDAFINWLTQNSVNIAVSAIFAPLEFAGGLASAKSSNESGSSSVAQKGISASSSVASFFGDLHQAMLLPNISGNQPTGDVVWSEDRNIIYYKQMRAKDEYIKKIDDYFTKFRI